MNKSRGRRKKFIIGEMLLCLLSTFSNSFFGVKFLYDYWFCGPLHLQ
jgi:hypothetical protein